MGILILGGILFRDSYFFNEQGYLRILFGAVFILYGLFRGINGYFQMRNKRENESDSI